MTFKITLTPSGKTFQTDENSTILQAGLNAGSCLPYSCRSGVCQTCRGRVVQGTLDWGAVHPKYLTEEDKKQGFALLCCAKAIGDVTIEVDEISASAVQKSKHVPARVLAIQSPSPDVKIIQLGLPLNEPMIFRAGQYVEFVLRNGMRRSYSIATCPSSDGVRRIELHIKRVEGGHFTDYVFNRMQVRDVCRLELPLGSFFLREDNQKDILLLASGTGFAPIKSIIEYAVRKAIMRKICVYWGARTRPDLYQLENFQNWLEEKKEITFVPVLSKPEASCNWAGRTGQVHQALMDDHPDLGNAEVYACGAPHMVSTARKEFTEKCGLASTSFFADSFLTSADKVAA